MKGVTNLGNEERYPSNSNALKGKKQETPEKKVEKVVNGPVTTKKKSGVKKFSDVFLAEDWASVGSYILKDIIVPTIQNSIVEIVRNGIEMAVYGNTRPRGARSGGPKIAYSGYYDKPNVITRSDNYISEGRNSFSFDELVIRDYADADEILTRMDELIETYELATVADLYEFAGVTAPYTANNYGWTNIKSAKIVRLRGGGYTIDMPKALPIR